MKFVVLALALIGAASAGYIAPLWDTPVIAAPAISTYAAAPIISTYAATPIISSYSAPIVDTWGADTWSVDLWRKKKAAH